LSLITVDDEVYYLGETPQYPFEQSIAQIWRGSMRSSGKVCLIDRAGEGGFMLTGMVGGASSFTGASNSIFQQRNHRLLAPL
jgi:hypothetical protein